MPGSGFYLAAFWELNSNRPVGLTVAQIPGSAIEQYAERRAIEGDDFDFFVRMIRAMDDVVMAQAKSDQPASGKPKPAGRALSPELFDAIWG